MKERSKLLPLALIASLVAVAALLVFARPSLADGGPHGSFTATTDGCAGCHRAHTAQTTQLLVASVPGLCLSCHSGTGANTNVMSGIYEGGSEGVPGQGLRGGGFTSALMDTSLDGLSASTAATSTHEIFGAGGTMWGHGPIGSGPGTYFGLTCTDCHNPHGENTYRSLRATPNGSGAAVPVPVTDLASKNYTVQSPTNKYLGEGYGSLNPSLSNWCSQCHSRYLAGAGSGHTDSGDPIYSFRHRSDIVPCTTCHVAHGTAATMAADGSGAVKWPDGSSAPSGDARSSLLRADNRGVCVPCHVSNGRIAGGCNSCHAAPPATGAHLAHSSPDVIGYGMTGSYGTGTSYAFGCGECHPTDAAMHQDGTVEVDVNPATAPAGSLKEQNSPAAAYNGNSCGGVYCHSGEQVSSGSVGLPLMSGTTAILDSHGNLTYNAYLVNYSRSYATTPNWSGGSVSGNCNDCHAFPLTSSVPGVQAGVGDTHQWVDDYGYGNLHAYNMSYNALACYVCHYGEIGVSNTSTRDGMDVTTYNPVPLADVSNHVNGVANVAFNTVNIISYNTPFTLAGAVYNPVDKSCANVACHLNQNYVVWGTPYRWWVDGECDLCHRMFLPVPPPLVGINNAPGIDPTPLPSKPHDPPIPAGSSCVSCHEHAHGR